MRVGIIINMPIKYKALRVYKESAERLKIKAAKKKKSIVAMIDEFSKEKN